MTDFPSQASQLGAALAREHVLVAASRAQDQLAGLTAVVADSSDTAEALQKVRDLLDLDEAQATAVLDMQVRRLSASGRARVREELEQIQAEIERLRAGH